jgi:WhiB family redox-sensing transcriptional regulator
MSPGCAITLADEFALAPELCDDVLRFVCPSSLSEYTNPPDTNAAISAATIALNSAGPHERFDVDVVERGACCGAGCALVVPGGCVGGSDGGTSANGDAGDATSGGSSGGPLGDVAAVAAQDGGGGSDALDGVGAFGVTFETGGAVGGVVHHGTFDAPAGVAAVDSPAFAAPDDTGGVGADCRSSSSLFTLASCTSSYLHRTTCDTKAFHCQLRKNVRNIRFSDSRELLPSGGRCIAVLLNEGAVMNEHTDVGYDADHTWMLSARCRELPPDEFFPSDGVGVDKARLICRECPVQAACLEYALRNRIDHGVWGGASERERRRILKRRRQELDPQTVG